MLLMIHLAAVLFYFIARQNDFDDDTWIVRYNLQHEGYFQRYITAFYWATQTITTVGYGDIASVKVEEKILAIIWMILGAGFYSITISNMSALLQNMNQANFLLSHLLNDFEYYNGTCQIPMQL